VPTIYESKIPWYSEVNIFDFTVINAMISIEHPNMELGLFINQLIKNYNY